MRMNDRVQWPKNEMRREREEVGGGRHAASGNLLFFVVVGFLPRPPDRRPVGGNTGSFWDRTGLLLVLGFIRRL